ncbi:MAG: thioredoxin family protein [Planctomycetaceae bacterium]
MLKRCQTSVFVSCFLFAFALLPQSPCRAADVRWEKDLESALQSANRSNRLVLLKFTADWCGYCKKMEKTTFADDSVVRLVNNRFVPVLVDADENKDLVSQLKIKGLPALLIVSPDMLILERITGYQTAEKLLPQLNQALAANQPAQQPTQAVSDFRQPPAPRMAKPVSRSQGFADDFGDDFDRDFDGDLEKEIDAEFGSDPFANDAFGSRGSDEGPGRARVSSGQQNPFGFPERGDENTNPFAGRPPAGNPFAEHAAPGPRDSIQEARKPAFGGLCLTSVVEERRLVTGRPEIVANYHGRLLFFESEQQKRKFLAAPEKYWPMLDGDCPLTLLQTGQHVSGELQYAAVFRQRIWLFRSPQLMQEFISAPAEYVDRLQSEVR